MQSTPHLLIARQQGHDAAHSHDAALNRLKDSIPIPHLLPLLLGTEGGELWPVPAAPLGRWVLPGGSGRAMSWGGAVASPEGAVD